MIVQIQAELMQLDQEIATISNEIRAGPDLAQIGELRERLVELRRKRREKTEQQHMLCFAERSIVIRNLESVQSEIIQKRRRSDLEGIENLERRQKALRAQLDLPSWGRRVIFRLIL